MRDRFYLVDAFADEAFRGNPAGVVISTQALPVSLMQNLAMEFGFSETSFIHKKNKQYCIRWYTPAVEASLCGHATLAAAHVLWSDNFESVKEIVFASQSGLLKATRTNSKEIALDFPNEKMEAIPEVPTILVNEFGTSIKFFGKNRIDYVLELETEDHVASYIPNFKALIELGRGLVITAKSTCNDYDFVSRVFAPSEGIPEDPVTGAAHCCLGPYWSHRLAKTELVGRQLSKRSGFVKTKIQGNRVVLSGSAVTILSGQLNKEL
ncbi:MAG: PhzF family phenazine biosynthesis protein [Bdellovibrionaceae bacterium]|nr:PhzF family phenazine biosynthesis protein [Pseudobdellovibrionaceae bacterium]